MSRVLSFRDLKRVPTLSGLNELDMLQLANDGKINSILGQLGFNIKAPILYEPSIHRDMSGHVEMGYRAVGEINNDSEYLNSKICPIIERLIWAARKDMELAREICRLMGHSVNLATDDAIEEDNGFPDEDIEPDYEIKSQQIALLVSVRDAVRGDPYNEYGNLKTPNEYQ